MVAVCERRHVFLVICARGHLQSLLARTPLFALCGCYYEALERCGRYR